MELDNESWLIEIGDEIIHKKSNSGYDALDEIEKAIYCFWVVDYAVRNSGTLDSVEDLNPNSIPELIKYANENQLENLSKLLSNKKEEQFCREYYGAFEKACSDLRQKYNSH